MTQHRHGGITGQQQISYTVTVTAEQPQGTPLSSTITNTSFYLKFDVSSNSNFGTSYGILKTSFVASDITASITPSSSNLAIAIGDPMAIDSSELVSDNSYATQFYSLANITGTGTGVVNLGLAGTSPFQTNAPTDDFVLAPGSTAFNLNIPDKPSLTIGSPENANGVTLPDEITVKNFFVPLTWDRNIGTAFSGADITVSSSNTNMSVTRSLPENTGTVGTTTHFRTELTITGDGITEITFRVRRGAIPASGALEASDERIQTFSINTLPSPMLTIGVAQSPPGTDVTTITERSFSVPLTWDRNVGAQFTRADVNAVSNNATLQVSVGSLDIVTAGTHYLANLLLSGGGSGVITVFVERGSIPSTPLTSQNEPANRDYDVQLPAPPVVLETGTMAGPSSTQGGGSVLLKPGGSGSIEPPSVTVTVLNIDAARQPSTVPVNLDVSFVWNEAVRGFNQGAINYNPVPRESEHGDPTKEPQLTTWSGIDGNATYQQTIEIQADSSGEINLFIPPQVAESVENEEVYGPKPPGFPLEIFYDTTIAGNPAPTVNISTPPTSVFFGETYTQIFLWSQPIQDGTFTTDQIIVDGATKGPLVQDPSSRNRFTMLLTLPSTGSGEVSTTVLDHRIISTAAKGIVSRRQGPEGSQTELFRYDQSYSVPTSTTTGGTTICQITEPIRTNPYLDNVTSPNPFGGAFAGSSDLTYISYRGKEYLYGVVQIIKRRLGTTNNLSNENEAGAALFEVNLTDATCRIIKQYAYMTIAARSLIVHQNRLWWFEGSHYGNHEKYATGYPNHLGDLFSLEPGTTTLVNEGVTRRTQFESPEIEQSNYGYHTQMASPMVSDDDNLYMISGFGGQESITSTNYATSRRPPREAEAETDIRNWSLINYSKNLEQRIELFNANGQTGWDALNDLARLTNSFIGFDRYGAFYFKPKGGMTANVQSSAPGSLEFKNESGKFPQEGLILVNDELIRYSGIIGRQFLNLERAQEGTMQVIPCENAKIHLIDHVLRTNQPIFDPIENANIRDTSDQIYNKIIVEYADTTYEYEDASSINLFGERIYNLQLPLTQYQSDWVEAIAQRFINRHKDMHYLINLTMDLNVDYDITDTVFLSVPDRAHLNLPCQIYEIRHTVQENNLQTNLTLRTI